MKIVMLEGSPNRNGSSNMLAEEFAKGAKEAGHEVTVISAAHSKISPCTGCVSCGYNGPCVQKDDMEHIRKEILGADMPRIMYTFFDTYDFGGKTIAPFCTSGGSGLSGTIGNLEAEAEVLDGLHISGSASDNSESSVAQWLDSIR